MSTRARSRAGTRAANSGSKATKRSAGSRESEDVRTARAWLVDRLHVNARIVLLLGLLVAVAIRLTVTRDVFSLTKITALWVFGVLSLAMYVMSAAERRVWLPRLRLAVPGAVFLAILALATVFSVNWRASLVGMYGRYDGLIPLCLYALIALLIVALYWEEPHDLKDHVHIAICGVVADAGVVLLQKAGMEGIQWADFAGNKSVHPVGTLGNSNFAGAFLGIALPFCLHAVLTARHRLSRILLAGVVLLDVVALWLTATRGGMVAAVAGAGCMLFLYRKRLPAWARRAAAVGVCLTAITFVAVVVHPGMRRVPGPFAKLSVLKDTTLIDRVDYWIPAMKITLAHPFLGTGPDTFFESYLHYRAPQDGASSGLSLTDEPHNVFLGYAAGSGLLGLAGYLAVIGFALGFAARRLKATLGEERGLLAVFVAVLVAYLAQAFFSIDVPPLAVFGWVALGGIACLADPAVVRKREGRQTPTPTPRWVEARRMPGQARVPAGSSAQAQVRARWAIHACVVAVASALVLVGVRPWIADYVAQRASKPTAQGMMPTPDQAIADYRRAAGLNPLEPTYPGLAATTAATTASKQQGPDQAAGWLARAISYDVMTLRRMPGDVLVMANVAEAYTAWAGFEPAKYLAAQQWWIKTLAVDPTDWQVHDLYAHMLGAWATQNVAARNQQIHQLIVVTRMRPTDAGLWAELAGAYHVAVDPAGEKAALGRALALDPSDTTIRGLFNAVSGVKSSP
jgi:O-antigen ligase